MRFLTYKEAARQGGGGASGGESRKKKLRFQKEEEAPGCLYRGGNWNFGKWL